MRRGWRRAKRPRFEVLMDPRAIDSYAAPVDAEQDERDAALMTARAKVSRDTKMRMVRRAMKKMDPREAHMVELYFLGQQHHSYRTLAAFTGDGNPGSAHRDIRRAIRNLKQIIKG